MIFMIYFLCLSAFCGDPNSIVDPSVLEREKWQIVQKDIAVLTQDEISQQTKEQEAAQLRAVQEEPQQKIAELELRIADLEVEDRRMELEELQKKTEEQQERLQRMQDIRRQKQHMMQAEESWKSYIRRQKKQERRVAFFYEHICKWD